MSPQKVGAITRRVSILIEGGHEVTMDTDQGGVEALRHLIAGKIEESVLTIGDENAEHEIILVSAIVGARVRIVGHLPGGEWKDSLIP